MQTQITSVPKYIVRLTLEAARDRFYREGSGLFGSVWSKENCKKVVKVYDKDSGYEQFLDMVVNNYFDDELMKHFPRIFQWKKAKRRTGIVVMEKLEKFALPRYWVSDAIKNYGTSVNLETVRKKINKEYRKRAPEHADKCLAEARSLWSQTFQDAHTAVYAEHDSSDGSWMDLHSGNVMCRVSSSGRRCAVITDPYAGCSNRYR